MVNKVEDLKFEKKEKVLLKVSLMKGVMWFVNTGMLSLGDIRPFEVLKIVGFIVY